MSVFLIFLSVPIILIINKFLINKNLLLNFSGEIHQGFTSKTSTPLSGGIAIMIFLFINLLPENINILVFFSLVFVLGIISDTATIYLTGDGNFSSDSLATMNLTFSEPNLPGQIDCTVSLSKLN